MKRNTYFYPVGQVHLFCILAHSTICQKTLRSVCKDHFDIYSMVILFFCPADVKAEVAGTAGPIAKTLSYALSD